ncbi:hypothetical protein ACHAWF_014192 [Thalassiosira exigua]
MIMAPRRRRREDPLLSGPALPVCFLLLCLSTEVSPFLLRVPLRKCQLKISSTRHNYHPAVDGWEQKYSEAGGEHELSLPSHPGKGPKILSTDFEVRAATESDLLDLDVAHWPVWTTADKEKWAVGNRVVDKEMPYSELSYVKSGKLEVIPQSTGVPVIILEGDFVTFPRGFVASWKVLEELTWSYFLY